MTIYIPRRAAVAAVASVLALLVGIGAWRVHFLGGGASPSRRAVDQFRAGALEDGWKSARRSSAERPVSVTGRDRESRSGSTVMT
jgi:hypothetical protein